MKGESNWKVVFGLRSILAATVWCEGVGNLCECYAGPRNISRGVSFCRGSESVGTKKSEVHVAVQLTYNLEFSSNRANNHLSH